MSADAEFKNTGEKSDNLIYKSSGGDKKMLDGERLWVD